MKILLTLCLVIFCFSTVSAQKRYLKPIDEASKDASFLAFRSKLIKAAQRRDVKYILSIIDPNIKITFGEGDGIESFKKDWKIEKPNSDFWKEFLAVITNGGSFYQEKDSKIKTFYAPYVYSNFPEDLNGYDYSAIIKSNVVLRAEPRLKSKEIARLSYNIVKIEDDESGKNTNRSWVKVKTFGSKTGFVNADEVRSAIDFRAGFEKIDGNWRMTVFIAGD